MKNSLPSPKQKALLDFIGGFIARENYAPSYREVMRALDYKSVSTVAKHVDGLIERGWLVKRENSKRSLEVVYGEDPAAKATLPEAPSVIPPSHEAWLADIVREKLDGLPPDTRERQVIRDALMLLGLDDVAGKALG